MANGCYSFKELGKLKCVHVIIDTYSGFLMASAQPGEGTKHVIAPCLKCFSYMRMTKILKTDNGSRYIRKSFQQFCILRKNEHKTGIPSNLQGQGIVERAHGSLKVQFKILKNGNYTLDHHIIP